MASPAQPMVATSDEFETANVVETPTSPSSAFTLSRFEFETGTKGNEGTKILLVEWDAAAAVGAAGANTLDTGKEKVKSNIDEWEVKWDGKEALTVLPIRDADAPEETYRVYFLLPPGAPIPTLVTISKKGSGPTELHTKPLPAIFPEVLVNEDKGTRGVLHTIWAKKRLQELEAEIVAEMRENGESVGLEMALQERQWIMDHFGLQIDTSSAEAIPLAPHSPDSSGPASPRSPIGGRLGEKLRGLKLATSPAELAAAKGASQINTNKSAAERKITAFTPESGGAGYQGRPMMAGSSSGMASLSAVIEGGPSAPERGGDTEEDLFALPMSPRSPEMAMSPFSLLKS